jgi:tRNA (cytidine/uridine-2'-O-)-methyltransferase
MKLHVALHQPEIPPNTGSIIRLCANTGAQLHLIHPLGFRLDDRHLRRAGLDYHEYVNVREHQNLPALRESLPGSRLIAFSTRGSGHHTGIEYQDDDVILFGSESKGLPEEVLSQADLCLRIPMRPQVRSLNLSNAVAVVVYEAWRQRGFG